VGFNLSNTPIAADSGSLFRLPITPASLADIESVAVIISTDSNKAVQPAVEKILAPVNKYPTSFAIYQNYPNPFNGSTIIEYDIPDVPGKLKIAYLFIYDILGRKVKTLASGEHEAKRYSIVWDGRNDNGASVASGVYFYQLIGKDFVSSKKMVYIK
ncbi:MAG: FlgD immunoglobulin-like domain containing protein, partial [Bacteroidota bacterium]